jgi:hypothetical protein
MTNEFLKNATLLRVLVLLFMLTICRDSLTADYLTKERVFAISNV